MSLFFVGYLNYSEEYFMHSLKLFLFNPLICSQEEDWFTLMGNACNMPQVLFGSIFWNQPGSKKEPGITRFNSQFLNDEANLSCLQREETVLLLECTTPNSIKTHLYFLRVISNKDIVNSEI